MTPGKLARLVLGPAFKPIGEAYRRIFVDMPKVVAALEPHIPRNAHVLDVGGGDGYVVNLLLDLRPDIRVTMTDIAPSIGSFIEGRNLLRTTLLPGTDVSEVQGQFAVITVADVIHHVPRDQREAFFCALADAAHRTGARTVLVKDVEPGSFRSLLAVWSDWYITGDRHVRLHQPGDVAIPTFRQIAVFRPDPPNYCLAFTATS